VCAFKLRKDRQCVFDLCSRFIEALELHHCSSRQAKEVGVFRVLVQRTGADGFSGFGLAGLQELLRLLKQFLLSCLMGNRSSPNSSIAYVTALQRPDARGFDRGRYRFKLTQC
jgi:hypothetical protein